MNHKDDDDHELYNPVQANVNLVLRRCLGFPAHLRNSQESQQTQDSVDSNKLGSLAVSPAHHEIEWNDSYEVEPKPTFEVVACNLAVVLDRPALLFVVVGREESCDHIEHERDFEKCAYAEPLDTTCCVL